MVLPVYTRSDETVSFAGPLSYLGQTFTLANLALLFNERGISFEENRDEKSLVVKRPIELYPLFPDLAARIRPEHGTPATMGAWTLFSSLKTESIFSYRM